ncbi:hypothetical protein [Streptosporangium nondiastaticum]|uniref:hypothetical protein n=1 Tax=Streptosporangium nondiastaticum TaxID=35764 RepID=UPI00268B910F
MGNDRERPGSSVLRLVSGTDRAVFVGDLIHSPLQVLHPSCGGAGALEVRKEGGGFTLDGWAAYDAA